MDQQPNINQGPPTATLSDHINIQNQRRNDNQNHTAQHSRRNTNTHFSNINNDRYLDESSTSQNNLNSINNQNAGFNFNQNEQWSNNNHGQNTQFLNGEPSDRQEHKQQQNNQNYFSLSNRAPPVPMKQFDHSSQELTTQEDGIISPTTDYLQGGDIKKRNHHVLLSNTDTQEEDKTQRSYGASQRSGESGEITPSQIQIQNNQRQNNAAYIQQNDYNGGEGKETGNFNSKNNFVDEDQTMPQSQIATGRKMVHMNQQNIGQDGMKYRVSDRSVPKQLNFRNSNEYSPMLKPPAGVNMTAGSGQMRNRSQDSRHSAGSRYSQNSQRLDRTSNGASQISNGSSSRIKAIRQKQSQALNGTIPSSIHSGREHSNGDGHGSFAYEFQNLYSGIQKIYPNFIQDVGQVVISPNLKEDDGYAAIQVYHQMNFMYQQAKKLIFKQDHRSIDEQRSSIESSQLHNINDMLKYQVENTKKESDYYKKQMDVFKEQLQIAQMREQDTDQRYEQRVNFLSQQVHNYEVQINDLRQKLNKLEIDEQKRLSEMQLQKEDNVSFRANAPTEPKPLDSGSFKSPTANSQQQKISEQAFHNQIAEQAAVILDKNRQIFQLNCDIKDIRSRLKLQEEMVGFEKDHNKMLNDKMKQLSQSYDNEKTQAHFEKSKLEEEILQKEQTIQLQNNQIDDLLKSATLEFPLMQPKQYDELPTLHLTGQMSSLSLINQKQPKFVKMTANNSKRTIIDDVDDFEDEVEVFNIGKGIKLPQTKGKSNANGRAKSGSKSTKQQSRDKKTDAVSSLFSIQTMLQTQINTTAIADEIIIDHKKMKDEKLGPLNRQLQIYQEIHERLHKGEKEKKDLDAKQVDLTKQNEDLKVKFSQLLDQFQEYVNESERKVEEEQMQQKDEQEKLLNDLNNTIKELEEMSQSLQNDVREKDLEIQRLVNDKVRLTSQVDMQGKQYTEKTDHLESIQKVKIESLNEEIAYLKKHYMVELESLRQENRQIRGRLRNQNEYSINEDLKGHTQNSQSPYRMPTQIHESGQTQVRNLNNNSLLGRPIDERSQDSRGNRYPDRYRDHTNVGETPVHADDRQFNRAQQQLVPQELDSHRRGRYRGDYDTNQMSHAMDQEGSQYKSRNAGQNFNSRHGDSEYDHPNARNKSVGILKNSGYKDVYGIRSKSYDRVVRGANRGGWAATGNRRVPTKGSQDRDCYDRPGDRQNQYSNYSREESREGAGSRKSSQNSIGHGSKRGRYQNKFDRTKNIISTAQSTFDDLKRDVKEKNKLIDKKNREIVKLRLENDNYKSVIDNEDKYQVQQKQMSKIISELDLITDNLKIELERTKMNLFKDDNMSHQQYQSDTNQRLKNILNAQDRSENTTIYQGQHKFFSQVEERTKALRNLISLASEVFLLTNKLKYSQSGVNKKGQNENHTYEYNTKLIDENHNLQKTVYKYEQTLAQLDQILRKKDGDQKDNVIFELKKLTDTQLQEIVKLQADLSTIRREKEAADEHDASDVRVLKKEINMLREQKARGDQLQDGNDELVNERRSLLLKIQELESTNQQAQNTIKEVEAQVQEKINQQQDLRSRITVVAELFEKKPIKQTYSFEVLCDFIHDKAKRLFAKYETAIKDRKSSVEEKAQHYQKKIKNLEVENLQMRDTMSLLRGQMVPKIIGMLNKQVHSQEIERLSGAFLRELIDDLEYQYNKYKNEAKQYAGASLQHQQKVKELQMMVNPYSNQNITTDYPQTQNFGQSSAHGQSQGNDLSRMGLDNYSKEVEEMRNEKKQLNNKLEEFAAVLGDFQRNQKTYMEENQQLKQQIGLLQSISMKSQISNAQLSMPGTSSGLADRQDFNNNLTMSQQKFQDPVIDYQNKIQCFDYRNGVNDQANTMEPPMHTNQCSPSQDQNSRLPYPRSEDVSNFGTGTQNMNIGIHNDTKYTQMHQNQQSYMHPTK